MTDKDWNPDDLLDFQFDHPVTKEKSPDAGDFDIFDEFDAMEAAKPSAVKTSSDSSGSDSGKGLGDQFDSYDEFKRYERAEMQSHSHEYSQDQRHSYEQARRQEYSYEQPKHSYSYEEPAKPLRSQAYSAEDFSSSDSIFDEYDREYRGSHDLVEEVEPQSPMPSAKELKALREASKEAHERYKSNYTKGHNKRAGRQALSKGHKWLTVIYTVFLAAFVGSMTIMNVLPFEMLIAMYVILALITLLILIQTRKSSVKKWGKRAATFLALVLIVFYGVGTAYAMGTLSFLSETSVDNSNAVANITKDPFNVVITGMDVSGKIDEQGRSDVNMVLTVNPETATVLMTSIPRDYEVYMPDYGNEMDKLTHTGFYSVNTTILAEEELLDMTANYYVKVNFTTLEKFIDAIGGVDVYSEYEFNPVKMKDWTVQEGMNHMNGKQALAFARERKAFATGDNQRIKNQQAVFEAAFKKATSSRTMLFSYSKILSNLKPYFEMSFSSKEIRQLAKMQLARFPDWGIYKNTIIGGDGNLNTYTAGYAYVMTQDQESIEYAKSLMNAVINGQALAADDNGVAYIAGE